MARNSQQENFPMQPQPQIVPALAGTNGETLAASLTEETEELVIGAAHAVTTTWTLRSGPFFVSDGQLATIIAQVFAEEQPGEIAGS